MRVARRCKGVVNGLAIIDEPRRDNSGVTASITFNLCVLRGTCVTLKPLIGPAILDSYLP